jgi:Ni/Fe-hydrogenase subunit HybB-like protein
MTVTLIASLEGLAVGCAAAAVASLCLLLSRSQRRVKNRFVMRLCQLLVLGSVIGGLLAIQVLEQLMHIKRHTTSYYAIIWGYLAGYFCVVFFALRADFRWQKSIGLDRETHH